MSAKRRKKNVGRLPALSLFEFVFACFFRIFSFFLFAFKRPVINIFIEGYNRWHRYSSPIKKNYHALVDKFSRYCTLLSFSKLTLFRSMDTPYAATFYLALLLTANSMGYVVGGRRTSPWTSFQPVSSFASSMSWSHTHTHTKWGKKQDETKQKTEREQQHK